MWDSKLCLKKALDVFGPDKHANNPFYNKHNLVENTITKLRKYGRYLGNPKLKDKEAERLADTVFREADDMEHRQEFLMGMSEHQSFIDMVLGTYMDEDVDCTERLR